MVAEFRKTTKNSATHVAPASCPLAHWGAVRRRARHVLEARSAARPAASAGSRGRPPARCPACSRGRWLPEQGVGPATAASSPVGAADACANCLGKVTCTVPPTLFAGICRWIPPRWLRVGRIKA